MLKACPELIFVDDTKNQIWKYFINNNNLYLQTDNDGILTNLITKFTKQSKSQPGSN